MQNLNYDASHRRFVSQASVFAGFFKGRKSFFFYQGNSLASPRREKSFDDFLPDTSTSRSSHVRWGPASGDTVFTASVMVAFRCLDAATQATRVSRMRIGVRKRSRRFVLPKIAPGPCGNAESAHARAKPSSVLFGYIPVAVCWDLL